MATPKQAEDRLNEGVIADAELLDNMEVAYLAAGIIAKVAMYKAMMDLGADIKSGELGEQVAEAVYSPGTPLYSLFYGNRQLHGVFKEWIKTNRNGPKSARPGSVAAWAMRRNLGYQVIQRERDMVGHAYRGLKEMAR